GASCGHHLPRLRVPVAHYQPAAPLVPLAGHLGQIGVHLRLQRGGQHPSRTLTHHIIQQRDVPTPRPVLGDYSQHRRTFPTDAPTSALLETQSDHREGTPFPTRSTGLKHFSWSPDSTMLAAPLDKRMEIRRQDNGTIIRCIGHTERIHEASWSPDSRYVATAAGSSLTIWDPERGTPMAVLPLPGYPN